MKNTKERILILGGGGTLGHKLWQYLPSKFPNTFVSIRKPKAYYKKCDLFNGPNVIDNFDLQDFDKLYSVFNTINPSIIINCTGITPRRQEAKSVLSSVYINGVLPSIITNWCSKNNSHLIHFSTNCVFDGVVGNYVESDVPNIYDTTDIYGFTKSIGEVKSDCALVIRSSFIGREIFGGTELLEWFLSQEGKKVNGFCNALFTGLTTNQFSILIGDIIEKFKYLNGIYHVSSETISKYELLLLMKEAYKIDIDIEPDYTFTCKRNLNGDKFVKDTGFLCPSWHQMMFEMAADKTPYNQWRT